jgi:hypothetical protein
MKSLPGIPEVVQNPNDGSRRMVKFQPTVSPAFGGFCTDYGNGGIRVEFKARL